MFDKLVRLQWKQTSLNSLASALSKDRTGQDPSKDNFNLCKSSRLQQASCNIVEFNKKEGVEGRREMIQA